jgi:hypothetical protein
MPHCSVLQVNVEDVRVELPGPAGDHETNVIVTPTTGMEPPSTLGRSRPVSAQQPQRKGFDPQFVRHLLISCVQAAVALVRDPEKRTEHATERITLLLKLLDGM